jgi:HAD superfamily hydrolase (TIGR01509 family)
MSTRGLLVDLDDTLYAYAPAEAIACAALFDAVATTLSCERSRIEAAYAAARLAVKHRVGHRGSAHSRLLYLHEMLHMLDRPDASPHALAWNSLYWHHLTAAATLADGSCALLEGARTRGWRVAIVTDLTLDVQLAKLAALGLSSHIDALVASEEVAHDKPHPEIFYLAAARLGVALDACVMVGDDDARDGEGARRVGIPFYNAGRGGVALPHVIDRLWRGGAP